MDTSIEETYRVEYLSDNWTLSETFYQCVQDLEIKDNLMYE